MNFKKAIVTGAAAAVCVGSVLNVSAAGTVSGSYRDALKGKENLIIDVQAYKAAYSDLEAAFGDNMDAYIEHYLTVGIYEGRTKGVLFDPLAYAEAYSDIGEAFGDNILGIIDHYVTFGAAENRTAGTAGDYADIAEAREHTGQKSGAAVRNTYSVSSQSAINNSVSSQPVTNNGASSQPVINNSNSSQPVINNSNSSQPVINNSNSQSAGNDIISSDSSVSSEISNNTNSDADSGNNVGTGENSSDAAANTADSGNFYHHTTRIYADDKVTLIRVEYYDENNKLIKYSDIKNFDSSTNSYTEEIYHYDEENQKEVLESTNTYKDGSLVSNG